MLVQIPAVIRKPILVMSKPNNNEAGNNLTSKNLKENKLQLLVVDDWYKHFYI
jgi:hypothetical protein